MLLWVALTQTKLPSEVAKGGIGYRVTADELAYCEKLSALPITPEWQNNKKCLKAMTSQDYWVDKLDLHLSNTNYLWQNAISEFYKCTDLADSPEQLEECRDKRQFMKDWLRQVKRPSWMKLNLKSATKYKLSK